MNIKENTQKLKKLQETMHAYKHALGLLYYDAVTGAPKKTTASRGATMGVLSEVEFKLMTEQDNINLVNEINENSSDYDAQTAREALVLKRDFDKISKIPMQEYIDFQLLVNESDDIWHTAKENNDYELFKPYLKRLIDTSIKMTKYYDSNKDPYDVMLDEYEKGYSVKDLDPYFESLKENLLPLIQKIAAEPKPDTSFLNKSYPVEKQRILSDKLMEIMGIDRNHCAISETEHPFTIDFSKYDVRITTHYYEKMLASSIYSVIHEGGHGLYELNTADELQYGTLANGCSMGLHESQSRFYENIIGRSKSFVHILLPILNDLFPEQLEGIDEEKLYKALNKSEPSLIRIEADELTYSIHVMIRYEMEKMLISGNLSVDDAPKAWNELYKKYLGVDVPDNAHGILQDSHWASASFGYFPTYSLGSAYGVQILSAMKKDIPVWDLVENGEIPKITSWLSEHIHKYGRMYDPKDMLYKACGEKFNPDSYFNYLKDKFTKIYNL